jgi:LCP family protein required for cell wall assembly
MISNFVDPFAKTRPIRRLEFKKPPRSRFWTGCLTLSGFVVLLALVGLAYFVTPFRTNILLLGTDRAIEGTSLSRTDTIVLTTIIPLKPYVGMLSIPRDLWVSIPDVGENRINTAHFYAESEKAGSGPRATLDTIRQDFGVDVDYYIRVRFDSVQALADTLGGVEVEFDTPMSGYSAGSHVLNGEQSLAFVRDREGSDDFFRMSRGQLFLKSVGKQMFSPNYWPRLPEVMFVIMDSVDTNIPIWLWPRLVIAVLRTGIVGIDARTISREMVTPFTTSGGAQVLAPRWDRINPMLLEMFGQ